MRLKYIELNGFKSFSKKTSLEFEHPVVSIVGPNGSGKSNVVEAFRFVLGEQSMKSMRGKLGVDLIFKGSKNLPKGTKASVVIYFDNSDKIFKLSNDMGEEVDLNYDTVSIERVVHRDGLNKYILNGSEVRLRDINNLLASVNIGSSGHHIISQGEADRILNASSKDRKEMIEDALGLKIYQYRIRDSERKLERTENNMKEIALLRRENAPHLNFLKKQVEKIEKMKEMRAELLVFYREYLKKESVYLEQEKTILLKEKSRITEELVDINELIAGKFDDSGVEENKKLEELKSRELQLSNIHRIKGEIERKMGRIEGMIEMEELRKEEVREAVPVSREEMEHILSEVETSIDEALRVDDSLEIKNILKRIREILNRLNKNNEPVHTTPDTTKIDELKNTQREVTEELEKLDLEEDKEHEVINKLKQEIQTEIEKGRDKEREKFTLKVKYQELSSALSLNNVKEENINRNIESFENEIKEGAALIGSDIFSYKDFILDLQTETSAEASDSVSIDRNLQEELKRKIERIKIKLEDAGTGNGFEILKEYKDMTERDEFLMKEMGDLSVSIESLNKLISELKDKIDVEFKAGIKKINVEFQEFFSLMFGGGTGALSIVVENKKHRHLAESRSRSEASGKISVEFDEDLEGDEIEFQQGIEINVSLPQKKVKELHSLSGGERSLTSIALLFAMSQVNPPPFLILDETDAALDEANSRKYGDMIEKLSKHSQLIVVTHNRETMSRAGVLYGVTIGADGASKLLSVKFDEATAIAK